MTQQFVFPEFGKTEEKPDSIPQNKYGIDKQQKQQTFQKDRKSKPDEPKTTIAIHTKQPIEKLLHISINDKGC